MVVKGLISVFKLFLSQEILTKTDKMYRSIIHANQQLSIRLSQAKIFLHERWETKDFFQFEIIMNFLS